MRLLALLCPVLLVVGCAHAPKAECSLHGGSEWLEINSPHFRMVTNAEEADAIKELDQLEAIRSVLYDFLQQDPGSIASDRVEVTFLRDPEELHEWTAYVGRMDVEARYMVATPSRAKRSMWWTPPSTIVHEMAHEVAGHVTMFHKRWISEGIAAYLETVFVEEDGRHATVGKASSSRFYTVDWEGIRPLSELWQWNQLLEREDPEQETRMYASSWAWIHFLVNRHFDQFAAFLGRMQRAEQPREAFDAVFGSEYAPLENELREFFRVGAYNSFHYDVKLEPGKYGVEKLTPADVHAIRLRLAMDTGDLPFDDLGESVLADVNFLYTSGHENFRARQMLLRALNRSPEKWREEVKAIVTEFPNEAEAHYRYASAIRDNRAERLEHYKRALELDPTLYDAMNGLAWDLVEQGEGAKGLELAKKAVALAPWEPNILDTLAATYAASGQCALAAETERRAVDLLPARDPMHAKFARRASDYAKPDCINYVPVKPAAPAEVASP